MQIKDQYMRVFFLTGLQEYFRLKPIEIDARRVHEFLTSLQEDNTCQVTDRDGGKVELLVDSDMVTGALKLIHGEHKVSGLKLSIEEKKTVFKMRDDTSSEMVYGNLIDQLVRILS